ncbi:MAG: PAS domain S-box protein [Planctomycetota bacterium]|nr:PAS domain S-box protein [Planctomycetota bacterium]
MEDRSAARGTQETILDTLFEHVVQHDRELRIVWANRAACESVGLSREEIVGRHCYELWACRENPCPDCPVLEAMDSGERRQIEKGTSDGRVWSIAGYPLRDGQDDIVGGVEVTLEITDRTRAEQALRESQTLMRATVDNLPFDFFALDPEGRYMLQNAHCRRRWGELIGRRPDDLAIDEDTRVLWLANNRRALAGETIDEEVEFISRGGTGHYRNIITPIHDEGFIRGILGVNIDITEQKHAEAALRSERDLLNAIMQTSIAAITIVDRQGRITFANRQAEQLLGLDAREVLARAYNDVQWRITGEDGSAIPDDQLPFRRVMTTGQPVFDARHAIERPDGRRRLLSINGAPLRTETGEIGSVVFAMSDITERRRAEEALRESERRLATLLDNLPGMAYRCLFDEHWTMCFVSDGCVELTGYRPEDLIDNAVIAYADLIHPDDRRLVHEDIDEAVALRDVFQLVYRIRTARGAERWVWEQGRGIFDEDGRLESLEGFITDVTDRTTAEQDLRRERDLLSSIMEASPAAISLVDPQGRIQIINAAAERVLGLTQRQVAQERPTISDWPLFGADGAPIPERDRPLQRVRRDAEALYDYEAAIIDRDGRRRRLNANVVPLFDEKDAVGSVVFIVEDVTERKQAEEALIASERNYRTIFNAASDGFVIHDARTGRVLDVNDRMCELSGYSRDELLGRELGELVWDETSDTADEARRRIRLVDREGPQIFQWQSRRKTGEPYWTEVNLKSAVIGGEECIVAVVRDITERKRTEEQMRFHANLFNQIQDMVTATDLQGHITYVNDALCRRLGHSADELIGRHIDTYAGDPQRRAEGQEIVRRTREQGSWRGEVVNLDANGEEVILDCRTRLVRDEQGAPTGLIGISTDITAGKRAEEALIASERNYRAIFDAANDAIFIHDARTGKILDVNDEMTRLFGYSREEACRMTVGELSSGEAPYTDEEARRRIRSAAEEGPQIFPWRSLRKNGERFWAEVNLKSALIGGEDRIIAIVRDITERKQAENALRQSERKYRELFEGSRDGSAAVDMDGRITECNSVFCDMLGYRVEELRTLTYDDITPPRWHEEEARIIREQVLVRGYSDVYEKEYIRRDGTIFPVEVRTYLTVDDAGEPLGMWAVVRDITERKQGEAALRDREARLRLMMRQMPAVLWTVDRNLRFTSSQGRGLDKLGLRSGEVVGISLQQFFHTDDPDARPVRAHRRALAGESVSFQIDWAGCCFDTHVEPLRDGEGRIIGAIGTAHDVTERRQAEQEVRQRAETERLLLRELDHRVRNNLSSLISLIDMSGRATDDVPAFAASITSRVRAIATVHALLSTAQWQRVALRSLIMAMVIGERGRAVHLDGPPIEIPAAQVQAVGIVINELMTNSHKHGALSIDEGRLSIRWELIDADDEHARRLVIHWHESGGPRIDGPPDRGVGIELIEGLVRSELCGEVSLDFTGGAQHRLEIRLPDPESATA